MTAEEKEELAYKAFTNNLHKDDDYSRWSLLAQADNRGKKVQSEVRSAGTGLMADLNKFNPAPKKVNGTFIAPKDPALQKPSALFNQKRSHSLTDFLKTAKEKTEEQKKNTAKSTKITFSATSANGDKKVTPADLLSQMKKLHEQDHAPEDQSRDAFFARAAQPQAEQTQDLPTPEQQIDTPVNTQANLQAPADETVADSGSKPEFNLPHHQSSPQDLVKTLFPQEEPIPHHAPDTNAASALRKTEAEQDKEDALVNKAVQEAQHTPVPQARIPEPKALRAAHTFQPSNRFNGGQHTGYGVSFRSFNEGPADESPHSILQQAQNKGRAAADNTFGLRHMSAELQKAVMEAPAPKEQLSITDLIAKRQHKNRGFADLQSPGNNVFRHTDTFSRQEGSSLLNVIHQGTLKPSIEQHKQHNLASTEGVVFREFAEGAVLHELKDLQHNQHAYSGNFELNAPKVRRITDAEAAQEQRALEVKQKLSKRSILSDLRHKVGSKFNLSSALTLPPEPLLVSKESADQVAAVVKSTSDPVTTSKYASLFTKNRYDSRSAMRQEQRLSDIFKRIESCQ